MPRALRILIPGMLYHVYLRGNDRRRVVLTGTDRAVFLATVAAAVRRAGWRCLGYCVMENHYHLLLLTPEPNLPVGMQWLNGTYARRFNTAHERDGHLWQGRYGAKPVDDHEYLMRLIAYLPMNPVKGGECKHPQDYAWSSFRAIAGLERFDRGTIDIEGVRLQGGIRPDSALLKRLRRQVGLVFQFHHLFDHLSALRNITLAPTHVLGVPMTAAESRARELLASLGVEHRASALPRELSGGEAQRVAIARALAVDPPMLMMDEPTASLDPSRRNELGELLARLAGQNRTILLSTHDDDFARRWATTILRMEGGVVV